VPTVLRVDGLRVVIYPNDHSPSHVHVIGANGEAVFVLNCPAGPPTLRETYGFKSRVLRNIATELTKALHILCRAWESMHDPE